MSRPGVVVVSESENQARQHIAASEREISSIKAQLRALGPASEEQSSEASANSLTIAWIKTEGLPETAKPTLKLQLSSPIEDADLTSLFDPLKKDSTTVVFKSVETGQATLTVSATDADGEIPLGSSIAYDIATLVKRSSDDEKTATKAPTLNEPIVHELAVAILPPGMADNDESKQQETGSTESLAAAAAVCTVTLRITFVPSVTDQREQLYERLNAASRQKNIALQQLRRAALEASQQQQQQVVTAASSGSGGGNPAAAVQRGFLNKQPQEAQKSRLRAWYERTLGEQSMFRRVGAVAKNYILFFGVVGFFHFQGQLLALPPPV